MRRLGVLLVLGLVAGCGDDQSCDRWAQWGGDPSHTGASCAVGQPMDRMLARRIVDPFVQLEADDSDGDLLVHMQSPIIDGDFVYLMSKAGMFTPCGDAVFCDPYIRNSQVWLEKGYRWKDGQLIELWTFTSDWKPEPGIGFEPMFQPAVSGRYLYVPGVGGSVFKVDHATGLAARRFQPFGETLDPDTYVAGAVTADEKGNVYYTAMKLDHQTPYGRDATGWLVVIRPDGKIETRTFQELAPGAPAGGDLCPGVFGRTVPRPLPPPDDANGPVLPPDTTCGSQRPAINLAPAVADDGTIYLVSRAHFVDRITYVVAVNADLTPRWARSLDQTLDDACGATVRYDPSNPNLCREGARAGVDPITNRMPSGRVNDSSSSAPVALPDGSVLYGSYTSYNGARGHLYRLDAAGAIVATHDFGWDVTPAVWRHDGTYSLVIKNNTYTIANGVNTGPFYIEQLSPSFQTEWRYQLTNTKSCVRTGPQGNQVECTEDHPNGFEWCINAPAVDARGTVYATGEDGNAYAVAQGGQESGRVFLEMSIGAAYSPVAIDGKGRIYVMNDGALKVLGK